MEVGRLALRRSEKSRLRARVVKDERDVAPRRPAEGTLDRLIHVLGHEVAEVPIRAFGEPHRTDLPSSDFKIVGTRNHIRRRQRASQRWARRAIPDASCAIAQNVAS